MASAPLAGLINSDGSARSSQVDSLQPQKQIAMAAQNLLTDPPLLCEQCNKRFERPQELKIHFTGCYPDIAQATQSEVAAVAEHEGAKDQSSIINLKSENCMPN